MVALDDLELLMRGGEPLTLAEAMGLMRPAFFGGAACRGVEGVSWFRGDARAAMAVCRRCPVREPCLAYALAEELGFGVWGGTTPLERRRMQSRKVGRRRPGLQVGLRRRDVEPKKKTESWATPIRGKARGRALSELARRHREEFDRLYRDAYAGLEAEVEAKLQR